MEPDEQTKCPHCGKTVRAEYEGLGKEERDRLCCEACRYLMCLKLVTHEAYRFENRLLFALVFVAVLVFIYLMI